MVCYHSKKSLNQKQYRMTFLRLLVMQPQQREGAEEAQCLAEISLTWAVITLKNISYETETRQEHNQVFTDTRSKEK